MKRLLAVVAALVVGAAVASAQVPRVLSYQGILTDSQGRILPDGEYTLTIRLYDRVDATEPIYVEEQRVVSVRGVVNVLIGTVEPLPWKLSFDRVYYVGMSVNGSEELRPRTMLTAVPYALRAESAAVADVAKTVSPEALKGVEVQTTPSGPAGGDLTGTYPNPYIGNSKVTTGKIATAAVTTDKIAPAAVTAAKLNQMGAATGEYLRWNGTQWDPSPVSTDAWALVGNAATSSNFLGTTNAQPLAIRTNNLERMRIDASGNVGIGTTTPSNRLHVTATSNPVRIEGLGTDNTLENVLVVDANGVMKIRSATSLSGTIGWSLTGNSGTNPSTNFLGTTDGVDLAVRTNNTERLRVTSSGYVGIGTTTPSVMLDVSGDANIAGNNTVGGNISVSGNATISGNLSTNGNATLGDASSDVLTVNAQIASSLIPTTTNAFDLGTNLLRWRNGWFSGTVTASGLTLDGFTPGSVLFIGTGGALSQNNSNFFWDNTNVRLGIGTATPAYPLHVHAPTHNAINVTSTGTTGAGIRFDANSSGGRRFSILATGTAAGVGTNKLGFYDEGNGYIAVMDGSTLNVGIGATSPAARLHVNGGSIEITGSGAPPGGGQEFQLGSATSYRWIQSYNLMPLSINPLGNNVGIGTTTPSTELHVAQDNSTTGGGQLTVSGRTNQNKQTVIGFNVAGNYGQIQAVEQTVAVRPLALNPAGGNVGIGITTPSALLHVAGDALVNTDLTVNGNTQLGDAPSDNVTFTARVSSHIHPSTNATYDLGSSTLRWKDGWFSGTVTSQNATVTSLTPGSVVFAGTGGALSQNNANFFWDNTGSQLGLGTNSPGARLDVRPTASQLGVRIRVASSSTTNPLRIEDNSGQYRWRVDQDFDMYVTNSSGTDIGVWKNSGDVGIGTNAPATRLHLNNSSSAAVTERFTNTAVTTGFDVGITSTGTAELRHRNDFPIEVYVNNTRALRIEPTSSTTNQVPNIIGGDATNDVDNGYEGGFIGGGSGHFIGNDFAVIAGGQNNTVNGSTSAIVAGSANEVNSSNSFIGAGSENVVGGDFSAIVSGTNNGASGNYSFVGSGDFNFASGNYAGILGGGDNVASGDGSMAVGAGLRAESYREVVVGSYNTQATSPNATTWVATDRLFVVGNGQSDVTRSDALIIWKNGAAQFFGNVTLGDATSDDVTFTARVSSHIHPSTDAAYDLGSSTLRWKDGWFGGTVTSQNATVTSLTLGSVVFAGTGGALSQNNSNFFWDNTNTRLGIGTNTPGANLHVVGNATITSNTSVGGNLNVSGGATIGAGLTVSSGGATITGNTSTSGNLFAGGDLSVNGNTTLGSAAANQVTINAATVAVPNIPSSSTATQVVVWNSNNLERRAASGLISTYAWMLGGNAITNPATEWLGTTTTQPLVFRTNSTQILQLNTNGSIQRDGSGNTRGTNANDFQMSRSVTTQVASGSAATIAGGVNNTASGVQSFIGAGDGNTASNTNAAVVAGTNNVASGAQSAILGGENNQAIGQHSVVSGGQGNVAAGPYSAIAGGFNLRVGNRSFGFSGQTSGSLTDLSGNSNIAAFADVDLWLYAVRNQASQLRFYERSGAGGNNYTAFQAQDQSSDIVYTLPAAITAGGVLQTDASGNLSWVAPSAYGWQLNGNSITSAWNGTTGSFLGTTNTQPLVIATTNTSTPQPIQLWTNNAERMRITESGIVRIQNQATGGTTEFHVRPGNGNKTQMILQFGSNQAGTDLLQWQDDAGTVIGRIDDAGNLAIGTSAATAFLHVVASTPQPAARFEGASGGPALVVGTNGNDISEILHNTISVNPPNIGANSSATFTVTITGVNTGDRVFLTPPSDLEDELVFQGATVTGANTVTIKIRNVSGGAVDGSARDWNYLVVKP